MARGAKRVWALCTHPVFSGNAVDRLTHAPIERLIVTNSLPVNSEKHMPNLEVLSIAPLLAEAIQAQL